MVITSYFVTKTASSFKDMLVSQAEIPMKCPTVSASKNARGKRRCPKCSNVLRYKERPGDELKICYLLVLPLIWNPRNEHGVAWREHMPTFLTCCRKDTEFAQYVKWLRVKSCNTSKFPIPKQRKRRTCTGWWRWREKQRRQKLPNAVNWSLRMQR